MPDPTERILDNWGDTGTNSDPGTGIEERGFIPSKRLPPGWMNYIIRSAHKWIGQLKTDRDTHETRLDGHDTDIAALEASQTTQDEQIEQTNRALLYRGWTHIHEDLYDTVPTAAFKTGLAFSSGRLLAAGSNGNIFVSDNEGGSWNKETSPASTDDWRGCATDGTTAVLVGDDSSGGERIATAPSPLTSWTIRSAASTSETFRSAAWGSSPALFCAVGTSGLIQTAPAPATTWTSRTAAASFTGNFEQVRFINGAYYAVGAALGPNGEIQRSTSGTSWTQCSITTTATTQVIKDIAHGNGYHIAVGDIKSTGITKILRATDAAPTVFTDLTVLSSLSGIIDEDFERILFDGDNFVFFGTHAIYISEDGTNLERVACIQQYNALSDAFLNYNAIWMVSDTFTNGTAGQIHFSSRPI